MTTIPITLQSDEKRYYDRECPSEECRYTFKIRMKDWKEKVSDDEVHCPLCGHIDTSDKWFTQDQLENIKGIAISWTMSNIQQELSKSLKRLEQSTKNNKYVRIKFKPGKKITFVNNPIGQSEEWETEMCCEKCGTHYSVVGSAFFCPCCGYNSAINSYNDSLVSIKKMVESLADMKKLLVEKYDRDTAEIMCRDLLEGSIGDMVSAFQKFACCKYEDLSDRTGRVNDFQIVEKGSQLFEEITGHSYRDWLSDSELSFMKMMFQRRHILEHNKGIVDQRYLDKSGDSRYAIGQRIIVKDSDVYKLLEVLEKIGETIMRLKLNADDKHNN